MSKREKNCLKILYNDCKGLIWAQIRSILKHKEFEITEGDGSEISITHTKMLLFKQQGHLHIFSADCFNIHTGKGDKSKLGKGDCGKIQRAMTQLQLTHC